jgi:hypothetical protein
LRIYTTFFFSILLSGCAGDHDRKVSPVMAPSTDVPVSSNAPLSLMENTQHQKRVNHFEVRSVPNNISINLAEKKFPVDLDCMLIFWYPTSAYGPTNEFQTGVFLLKVIKINRGSWVGDSITIEDDNQIYSMKQDGYYSRGQRYRVLCSADSVFHSEKIYIYPIPPILTTPDKPAE